eukprot:scaffold429_cov269-Pinguiococcus_pyrenoidosus.AAC.36
MLRRLCLLLLCAPWLGCSHERPRTTDEAAWTQLLWRNVQVSSDVLILVLSRRGDFVARQTIRNTWAKGHANVLFVLGTECAVAPERRISERICASAVKTPLPKERQQNWLRWRQRVRKQLWLEAQTLRDVIVAPTVDTYASLPTKLRFALRWASRHSGAKWVVKADDDHFVRVASLERHLRRKFDASEMAVVGKIMREDEVLRKGRYKETVYNRSVYPNFPLGSCGYALSRPLVEVIAKRFEGLTDYGGEDTSLGIWLDEAYIRPHIRWIDTLTMSNRQGCKSHQFLIIGHNFTSKDLRRCYEHYGDEIQGNHIVRADRDDVETQPSRATLSPILDFLPIPFCGGDAVSKAGARRGVAWGACHHLGKLDGVSCPLLGSSNSSAVADLGLSTPFLPEWEAPLRAYKSSKPFRTAALFTVLRDPFQRVLAAFGAVVSPRDHDALNLNIFALRVCDQVQRFARQEGRLSSTPLLLPQHYHLLSANGEKGTTHEIRFEKLLDDMPRFARRFGLQVELVAEELEDTPRHLSVQDLSEEAEDCLRDAFRMDFSAFGYSDSLAR